MAGELKAGSAVIAILGDDKDVINAIKRTQNGFTGLWANIRDGAMTTAAIGSNLHATIIPVFNKFTGLFIEFAKFGDQMAKMSQRTGVSAQELSLLGFAAGQSGSSIESLGNGIKKLQKNLVEASRGEKTAVENFEHLGLSAAHLNTLLAKDRILVIADAIRNLGDEAKQAEAAMRIFGKGGVDLLPMLQEGSGGIGKLMDEAKINGIGISDEDAQKAAVVL
ncbi:hypothetical protein FACS189443_2630 [Planctomycetales bacterium]|nr:hypothetical protein FACS189443_2630 [Planctomycetales bacterium]